MTTIEGTCGVSGQQWPSSLKAWGALIGCFLLMANSWGLINAYGTFQSYYAQHLLKENVILLNLIGASECFWVLGLAALHGRLLDAGHSRILILSGTVLEAMGLLALSYASPGAGDGLRSGSYAIVYAAQGIILPLGMSCFFVASSYIAATWFPKRKTAAIGVVACGAAIAGLVYPVAVKELLQIIGFNRAVQVATGIACVTNVLAIFLAVPDKTHPVHQPRKWFALETWVDPHAWHNAAFRWYVLAIAWMFLGYYAIFFNLEGWAASNGFGYRDELPGNHRVESAGDTKLKSGAIRLFLILAIMNVSSVVGRVAGGFYAQAHGTLIVHGCVTFIAAILCLIMWTLVSNVPGAIAFAVVFGTISGAVIGLPPACVMSIADMDPNADRRRLGQWVGMMYTCAAIPSMVGPVIAGVIVQRAGYLGLQLFTGSCLAATAFCILTSAACAKHGSVAAALNVVAASDKKLLLKLFRRSRSGGDVRKDSASSLESGVTGVEDAVDTYPMTSPVAPGTSNRL